MPFNLGGPELLIILVVVLIVFGAGKLPDTMRDLGKGVREFKRAQSETDEAPVSAAQRAAVDVPASTVHTPTSGVARSNADTT